MHGSVLQQYLTIIGLRSLEQGGNSTFTSVSVTDFAVPSTHCVSTGFVTDEHPTSNPYGYLNVSLSSALFGELYVTAIAVILEFVEALNRDIK